MLYSKSMAFTTHNHFTWKPQYKTDAFINTNLRKLNYLKVFRTYFYFDSSKIYQYDFQLENRNFEQGFQDLQDLEKTTLNFHFGDNNIICEEVFDSILNSWKE